MQLYHRLIETPIGRLKLIADGTNLVAIEFEGQNQLSDTRESEESSLLATAAMQLEEYFTGQRSEFTLPLDATGTDFQRAVWSALAAIPYGEVRSYRDIARSIGKASAVRAVGAANGRNPLPIVVPCHRVIGSDGSLTGFAGGIAIKEQLLQLEGTQLA